MSKKSKPSKQKKHSHNNVTNNNISQADQLYYTIGDQMLDRDYAHAAANCERLLKFLPTSSRRRVEILPVLGNAYAMLEKFQQSYAAFSAALELTPNDAKLWFNRGAVSRSTMRMGQSLKDFMRGLELSTDPALSKELRKELKVSREWANEALLLRGPEFTLDQLVEQEKLFQRGLALMEAHQWDQAGQAFQASIVMGDCLPQPWSNLGACFMMQERYDESEAALQRSLAFDPKYAMAKQNLALLAEARRTGPPDVGGPQEEPFEYSQFKSDVSMIKL